MMMNIMMKILMMVKKEEVIEAMLVFDRTYL